MSARWFESFRRDPDEAVSDLFTGRAGVGSDMRLDVPDLLHQWFPPSLVAERAHLDDALFSWLNGMRDGYDSQTRRLGFAVYGKRVGEALVALQLLDLPRARNSIRANLDAWLRWLTPLRLAPARDPALECYRLLAHGQRDTGHLAMWLRLAADRRPEYLTVALTGLRLLPNNHDARKNQMLMLQALLHHAVVIHHDANGARRFFNRRFAALRGLFPRGPQHWYGVLDEVLDRFDHIETRLARDLVTDLRGRRPSSHQRRPTQGSVTRLSKRQPSRPVGEVEWQSLERKITNARQPTDGLAERLFDILERNHKYALTTGDSYHFVRTLSNLGSKLLTPQLSRDNMARFGVMIERALVWESANPYCWTLWAKWFQNQGRKDAQEAILRETLRLFPCDVAAQVELARLLIARGEDCWAEAEHHLHCTMAEDPDNGHAHVVMARLQGQRGRHDDAKKTLACFLESNPTNKEAREAFSSIGATAYADASGGPTEPDVSTRQQAAGMDAPHMVVTALQELVRRAGLSGEFIRARIAGSGAAQTKLISQESQKGDPLAGFYSQWLKLPDTPAFPPHAWAWEACSQWRRAFDAEAWDQLAKRFPEAAPETRLLGMLAAPSSSAKPVSQHDESESALARPIDAIMRDGWALLAATDVHQHDRDEFACSLMACAAINAPQFLPTKTQMSFG